ncbi:MAG: hypothetical protein EOO77_14885 [Oxalobacteraceae bacterium]|nr:MAG: hypothetical protein EOO77_14885 [Oxalobacteraceae bacterium]
MNTGHTLIDAAVKVCGSRYKVAKVTGLSQTSLSHYYSGKAPLSPIAAAKIAAAAGLDARDAMAVAAIENEKDPIERKALERVFFRTGAAATLLFFIAAGLLGPSPAWADQPSRIRALYIMLNSERWAKRVRGFRRRLEHRVKSPWFRRRAGVGARSLRQRLVGA